MTGSIPPSGTKISVSSTRKGMGTDSDVTVVNHNEIGVRVRLPSGKERFYPWGQIAFIEWDSEK